MFKDLGYVTIIIPMTGIINIICFNVWRLIITGDYVQLRGETDVFWLHSFASITQEKLSLYRHQSSLCQMQVLLQSEIS